MGKLDSMIKCTQARNLVKDKQYDKALEVIEKVNIAKVKSITDLKIIAEVYIKSEMYTEAREIYFRLYDRVQFQSVLYYMIYLSIKCSLIEEAEDFYEEYKKTNKDGVDCYVLKFYLEKAKSASRQEQIKCIQDILNEEYLEEWAYEIAKMYHKEGMEKECVAECGKIILWFGEGIIVQKAMLLKLHYVEGIDISSPRAIEETRNLAADLRIAAVIADRNDRLHVVKKSKTLDPIEDMDDSSASRKSKSRVIKMPFLKQDKEEAALEVNQETDEQYYMPQIEEEKAIAPDVVDYADTIETIENYPENVSIPEERKTGYFYGDIDPIEGSQDHYFDLEDYHTPRKEKNSEIKLPDTSAYDVGAENKIEENGPWQKMQETIEGIIKQAKLEKEIPHFSLMGNQEEKITVITKYLVKKLCDSKLMPTPRIARISAEKLNNINLELKKSQLQGACLLIENAHELSLGSLQGLYQLMRRNGTVLVALADTEEEMELLFSKNRKLRSLIKYELYV